MPEALPLGLAVALAQVAGLQRLGERLSAAERPAPGGRPTRAAAPGEPGQGELLLEGADDLVGAAASSSARRGHGLDAGRAPAPAPRVGGRRRGPAALGQPAHELVELEAAVAAGRAHVGHAAGRRPGAQRRRADARAAGRPPTPTAAGGALGVRGPRRPPSSCATPASAQPGSAISGSLAVEELADIGCRLWQASRTTQPRRPSATGAEARRKLLLRAHFFNEISHEVSAVSDHPPGVVVGSVPRVRGPLGLGLGALAPHALALLQRDQHADHGGHAEGHDERHPELAGERLAGEVAEQRRLGGPDGARRAGRRTGSAGRPSARRRRRG